MLVFVLLFAQTVSHFVRPHMPIAKEWKTMHKAPVVKEGDFVIPASGQYRIDYQQIHPCKYDGDTCRAAIAFCDHFEQETHFDKDGKPLKVTRCPGGNQVPIYDVDESYDHITVMSTPGMRWWYSVTIAVPAVAPSKVQ